MDLINFSPLDDLTPEILAKVTAASQGAEAKLVRIQAEECMMLDCFRAARLGQTQYIFSYPIERHTAESLCLKHPKFTIVSGGLFGALSWSQ